MRTPGLRDPVAKRLYRLLDKRFYPRDELVFDLHEPAFEKVRVSNGYNTAQIKRALLGGVRELEELWDNRLHPRLKDLLFLHESVSPEKT
jgi:hypothetical protein